MYAPVSEPPWEFFFESHRHLRFNFRSQRSLMAFGMRIGTENADVQGEQVADCRFPGLSEMMTVMPGSGTERVPTGQPRRIEVR